MKTCDAPAFVLRRSPIHGTGVFAARAITPGEFVIEYKGERVTKAEARRRGLAREAAAGDAGRVYLFELNKRYDLDGDIPDNPAKYINHSCAENCQTVCERGHIRIYAIRAIASGEELTFDYGYAPEHFLGHPCRCGTPHCLGYIVGRTHRLKLRQLLARTKKRKKEDPAA